MTTRSPVCPPLCDRRRPDLTIIPISYLEWNTPYNCNAELVLEFEDEDEDEDGRYRPTVDTSPRQRAKNSRLASRSHLVQVLPGFYIAVANRERDVRALRTFDNAPFSHVVELRYEIEEIEWAYEEEEEGEEEEEEEEESAQVRRLRVSCPTIALESGRRQTTVRAPELRAARDFLSLALPGGSDKWWPEGERAFEEADGGRKKGWRLHDEGEDEGEDAQYLTLPRDYGLDDLIDESRDAGPDEDVNVLVVAPKGRAVDVLAVLLCYLGFLEGRPPQELATFDLDHHRVWRSAHPGAWSMSYIDFVSGLLD